MLRKWLNRRRRASADGALLDQETRDENETYRQQHGSPLSSPAQRPTGFWSPERAEESEFEPPKY